MFGAVIPVQAKPLSRAPDDANNSPAVRIGILEPPVGVIEVESEVLITCRQFLNFHK